MLAPEGDNVDTRFEQSMDYNETHGYGKISVASDDYGVYVFSDCHLEESADNLDGFVNAFLQDAAAAPFAICLGDLVNGNNSFDEFISHTSPIQDSGRSLFLTAGNHDLFWGRWEEFHKCFGSSTYWFEVETPSAKDLFISVESAGGTLGAKQREWLEKTLKSKGEGYRHTVIFTHTNFFAGRTPGLFTDNFALEETYDLADLFYRYGVDMVLSGHRHSRECTEFKDVEYVVVDALDAEKNNAVYAVLSMGEAGILHFFRG